MNPSPAPTHHQDGTCVFLLLQSSGLAWISQGRKELVPWRADSGGWDLPSREARKPRGPFNVPITHSLGSLMFPLLVPGTAKQTTKYSSDSTINFHIVTNGVHACHGSFFFKVPFFSPFLLFTQYSEEVITGCYEFHNVLKK